MPIRPDQAQRYPADWQEISARIRERAGNKCEECGVANYAIGARGPDGSWLPNRPRGERLLRLDWPQPGELAWFDYKGAPLLLKVIRIVLTVAHLDGHPENCAADNLRCWCQRCHNRHDAAARRAGTRARARAHCAAGDLFG